MENYTALANEVHANNIKAGWWEGWDNKRKRHDTAMMLVVSELAEALEGDRKNLMDDHLPHHKMFDVELADALIRLLDLAGAYEVNLSDLNHFQRNKIWHGLSIPDQLMWLVRIVSNGSVELSVADGVASVLQVAEINNIDILNIAHEKMAYNKIRADHKRENRAKNNGKKY